MWTAGDGQGGVAKRGWHCCLWCVLAAFLLPLLAWVCTYIYALLAEAWVR